MSRQEKAQRTKEIRLEKKRQAKAAAAATTTGAVTAGAEQLGAGVSLSSGLDRSTPGSSQPPTPTGSDAGSSVSTPGTFVVITKL